MTRSIPRSLLPIAALLPLLAAPLGCSETAPPPAPPVTSRPQSERDVALDRAREAMRRRVPREAIDRLAPIVRAHPEDYDARVLLSSALLLAGDAHGGLREANLALAADDAPAAAWINKAAALTLLGEDAQARVAGERALTRAPDDRDALTNLATVYARSGAKAEHKRTLERLVACDGGDLVSRFALAQLALADADAPAAERLARDIVSRDPRHAPAQLLLAALAYDADDYPTALERAKIALAIAPDADHARAVLEAAFYVTVATELTCAHGPRPWADADAAAVLLTVRDRYALSGVSTFYDLDTTFGPREDVQARITRAAAKRCPPAAPAP